MIKNYEPLFRSILNGIKSQVNHEKSMETVFFDIMKENAEIFRKLGFIRYINIFNNLGADKIGHIEFYADFIHTTNKTNKIATGKKLITNKRDEIDIGNHLFDDNIKTIGQLLRDNREFGKSYEYVRNGAKRIEDNWRYSTIQHYNWHNDLYTYDHIGIGSFFKDKDTKKQFKNWLEYLNNCYDPENNGVTNFIFIIGPTYYGKDKNLEDELEKYTISANIGIDARKSKAASIVYFIEEFRSFIEQLSFNLTTDINDYQKRQTAVKSSLAQVMARNMSHNIGSHVLSNLIDDNTYEKLKDEEVTNIINSYISSIDVIVKDKNLQLPYFFQYLKSRMDYLSEVTFSVSNMATTKMMYGDVLKEFDRVRILLNYISGIRGFQYQIKARYNGEDLSDNNDVGISFVGDTHGNHAFMVILENQIRNTSKHSSNKIDITTFTINIKDFKCDGIKDAANYYCVEIDNGVKEDNINELVSHQNKLINESILDQNNKLRDHSLGLLEMETSAAFLRQIELPEIESDDYFIDNNDNYYHERNGVKRLNIIKAFATADGALAYRFFIPRPQEILIIGDRWTNISEARKNDLLKIGIQFVDDAEFVISMNNGTSYFHQFLLFKHDVSNQVKQFLSDADDSRTLLPLRKLELSENDIAKITDIIINKAIKDIGAELKEFAWAKYFANIELINSINHNIDILSAVDFSRSYNQVVFLHHADKDNHQRSWEKSRKHKDDLEAWIENLSSRTSNKLPEFNRFAKGNISDYIENIGNVCWIKHAIFEAYHNKVIVLDERVQKYSNENFEGSDNKNYGGLIPCSNLFESTNVFIPSTPLDPINYSHQQIEEIQDFITKNIDNSFLLLHYGILERMYKTEDAITKMLEEWSKHAKRVVVTSGRGSHSLNLPNSVCYANLSSVLNVFNEFRNKYYINYLFNQSRRKKE